MPAPKPFAELLDEQVRVRFYAKVAEPDEHGCLLWLASVGTKGYGVFNLPGGSAIGAHRVAYVLAHGADIPAKLVIDHQCRVRRCVNPEHLRAVSNRENLHAPGSEHWARAQSEQTHCRRGHELTDDNLDPYQLARGRRQCQACKTAYNRLSSRRRQAGTGWTEAELTEWADEIFAQRRAQAEAAADQLTLPLLED